MDWLDFDFDWQRYFYSFPKPDMDIIPVKYDQPHIVLHIASDNLANNHRMSQEYLQGLINKIPDNYKIIVLSTPSTESFVLKITKDLKNVTIYKKNIYDVIRLIKGCAGLIAIDSGIKYFGYTFNKPTITWAKETNKPHSCLPAFQMRWLTFSSLIMPLEHNSSYIVQCLINLINSKNLFLAPHMTQEQIDVALIRRRLKQ
jgi:ADP-heptose:LPS heptosyltransferase